MEEQFNEGKRGVRYPKVIDLIAFDQDSDSVVISMVEDRPWGESEEQLDQLKDKFNNYVDYILDGWLYSQFPQYQSKKCTIRIEGTNPPDQQQSKFFESMKRFCDEQNLGFEVV